ncbi:helix-turn-helix transcriptional regulator [Candidatus Dojkabacteria bacterium]|jgi:transcriptional regulator with XRE-family HTH domain|nr:helix-turn-helix transcriptional regulator [Candidatus Dojkabacteria bacterium]
MTTENVKNFLKLVSDEKSDWLEKANWRKENRDWLHNSQRIAIRILSELRKTEMSKENLAKNIGVSVKYINEILKGQKNLTLKTISKLEKGLGVKLIEIDIEITKHRYFVDIRCGCGAVRDRYHESYNKDYPGLHRDTPDVVEYKHGYTANGIWNMKDDDVTYLNELCNRLNIENINYDNR